jgi:hypothetical protein
VAYPLPAASSLAASFEGGVVVAARILSRFEDNTPQIFEQTEKLCLG